MIEKINAYSRRYEVPFGRGVHGKIANFKEFKRISGEIYGPLLVRTIGGDPKDLILLERNFNKKKEIIKIHSEKSGEIQSQLEKITGVDFSQYRIH